MILRPYQSAASDAIFKEWQENDPIGIYRHKLIVDGIAGEEELGGWHAGPELRRHCSTRYSVPPTYPDPRDEPHECIDERSTGTLRFGRLL